MDSRDTTAATRQHTGIGVFLASLPVFFLLTACADPPPAKVAAPNTCTLDDTPQLFVVRSLRFALEDASGLSYGFDLDGLVSEEGGSTGCGIGDYTSPDGTTGVDNAFIRIVPTLEATEAKISALEGLVQGAIDSGELLITFEVGGLESWETDTCVAVEVGKALGTPTLGTDGLILDGQTFDPDPAVPPTLLTGGAVAEGALVARGLSTNLPVQILNAEIELPLRQGAVHLEQVEDDLYTGFFAGGVSSAYLLEIASSENVDPVVAELLAAVLAVHSDLPDETGADCAAMSVTLSFEAVGAYWYP